MLFSLMISVNPYSQYLLHPLKVEEKLTLQYCNSVIEETKGIDIRWLRKNGWLKNNRCGIIAWNDGGSVSAFVQDDFLVLHYRFSANGKTYEEISQTISFDFTACNYGNIRKWLICPKCNKRVVALYAARKYFYCRHCYKLQYFSQQADYLARLIDQKQKLGAKIFQEYNGVNWRKKKGIHQKTFNQLFSKYLSLNKKINASLSEKFLISLNHHHNAL